MTDVALDWLARHRIPRVVVVVPLIVLVGLVVIAVLVDAVGEREGIAAYDLRVDAWFAAHRGPWLQWLALHIATVTAPAYVIPVVAVAVVALVIRRHVLEAVVLGGATLAAAGTSAVVKHLEGRPRPLPPLNLTPETEPSFPSGHVLVLATVVIVALGLAWHVLSHTRRIIAAVGVVVANTIVSLDRLVVGAHWLTDVLASLAMSAVISAVALGIYVTLRRR